jgi:AraC-like DNA-binding protein
MALDGLLHVPLRPVERLVRRTSLVALGEHRCSAIDPLFAGGGPQLTPIVGFMRTSLVRIFRGHEPQVHTPNVAGFHNVGSSYERRPLDAKGDQSDWIVPSPSLLEDLIDTRSGRHAVSRGEFFLKPFAPIRATAYLAQRHLFEALNADTGNLIPDLAVDEYAIHLLRIILRDAYQHWDTDGLQERDLRPSCDRRRRAIVEGIKERLATDYASSHSLPSLAAAAYTSPGQLARIFPRCTGFSLHSYQQQIRLRTSLQLVRDHHFELAEVAMQLGFASHSHFTTAFRRCFGLSPSQFAKSRSRGLANTFLQSMTEALRPRSALHRKSPFRMPWLH